MATLSCQLSCQKQRRQACPQSVTIDQYLSSVAWRSAASAREPGIRSGRIAESEIHMHVHKSPHITLGSPTTILRLAHTCAMLRLLLGSRHQDLAFFPHPLVSSSWRNRRPSPSFTQNRAFMTVYLHLAGPYTSFLHRFLSQSPLCTRVCTQRCRYANSGRRCMDLWKMCRIGARINSFCGDNHNGRLRWVDSSRPERLSPFCAWSGFVLSCTTPGRTRSWH